MEKNDGLISYLKGQENTAV